MSGERTAPAMGASESSGARHVPCVERGFRCVTARSAASRRCRTRQFVHAPEKKAHIPKKHAAVDRSHKKKRPPDRQPRTSVLLARRTSSPGRSADWLCLANDMPRDVSRGSRIPSTRSAECGALRWEVVTRPQTTFRSQCGVATPRRNVSRAPSSPLCAMLLSAMNPTRRFSRFTTGRRRTPSSAMLRATSSTL